ncbi:MAG TPA: 16S rRNA (adenine(1518)-N(6)/adenine(1519)-N(6))-dimethyltransferase RsmA [Rhodanobacteraceae bacterium]|nr:16S rRNA (adenine(1518)-N(6)/adenine(1519)-N(6))-dimethyltransferase RsmA [Rhodanobacteraceae bacterium]
MARPKKHYGQHFLHERGIIERIIAALAPREGDRIVEIGPGEGALTLPLLDAAHTLTAIELDAELLAPLRAAAQARGELTIIHADVLQVDLTALAGGGKLRLVGNLPYYVSSPILFHCLQHARVIGDMLFMLQKEVVDRMAAPPGSKTYGRLSVMLQLACKIEPLLRVPPGAFRPPPQVDSAVVRLIPHGSPLDAQVEHARVEAIVRAAFGKRRKTLANALSGLLDAEAIRAAGIDPRARAETLSPQDYVNLARSADLPSPAVIADNPEHG